jgi:virginiamycin B lyase
MRRLERDVAVAVRLLLVAVAASAACQRVRPGLPSPSPVREFAIPWENAFPSDMAMDARGRVWFTDRLTHRIGRFDPRTSAFTSYPTPTPKSAPYGMVVGPDSALWFAESRAGRLGRIDPADGGITEVVLPGVGGGPQLLARSGPRLWFTVRDGRSWGWYDPSSGEGRVYPGPPDFGPYGIGVAPDGSIWIAGQPGWMLLRVDASTDTAEVVELGVEIGAGTRRWLATQPDSVRRVQERRLRRDGQARRIAVDSAGGVWLTDFGRSRVVRYDPATGDEDVFSTLAARTEPYAITVSRAGLIWYSEKARNAVVALDPSTGERVSYPLPSPNATVRQILLDESRRRVWLPMSDAGKLGLIELR